MNTERFKQLYKAAELLVKEYVCGSKYLFLCRSINEIITAVLKVKGAGEIVG